MPLTSTSFSLEWIKFIWGNIRWIVFSLPRRPILRRGSTMVKCRVNGLNGLPASNITTSYPFKANSNAAVPPPAPEPTTIAFIITYSYFLSTLTVIHAVHSFAPSVIIFRKFIPKLLFKPVKTPSSTALIILHVSKE